MTDEEKKLKKEYDHKRYLEKKDSILERNKKYYLEHKEHIDAINLKYYYDNREEILEQKKNNCKTPIGRAKMLIKSYKHEDKKYNRGECTLTPEWIVENIFSGQKCVYCGEDDWTKLGCDRKNSDLPHTPENCVPCCEKCNCKKRTKSYDEFINILKG